MRKNMLLLASLLEVQKCRGGESLLLLIIISVGIVHILLLVRLHFVVVVVISCVAIAHPNEDVDAYFIQRVGILLASCSPILDSSIFCDAIILAKVPSLERFHHFHVTVIILPIIKNREVTSLKKIKITTHVIKMCVFCVQERGALSDYFPSSCGQDLLATFYSCSIFYLSQEFNLFFHCLEYIIFLFIVLVFHFLLIVLVLFFNVVSLI